MGRPGTTRFALHRALIPGMVIVAALLVSCELLFVAPVPDTTPLSIFDQVWTFADREYSFFDFKEIDWDAARAEYRPDVNNDMGEEELFSVLAQMLFILRDGHVNLVSPFDFSRNWQWYLDEEQNFDYSLLERNYFQTNEQFVGPFVVYDFGDVLYVYYASFASPVRDADLDYLLTTFQAADGIILDVRNNGGGSISNAYTIAGRLVDEPTEVARQRYKNGPAHDAFTPFEAVYITPPASGITWAKPFVVLTNRSSYSATNLMVALVRDLPQVRTIGDSTGGGGGIPTFTELTNGWYLRVSAHQFVTLDDFNVEDGIPPDDMVDLDTGVPDVDEILEAGLDAIRSW